MTGSGGLTTEDAADPDGFYEITGIAGEVNGVAITGLQPPDRDPRQRGLSRRQPRQSEAPQLSMHGFGYALADGTYANPFYGDHFVPPGVYSSSPISEQQDQRAVREIHRDDRRHRASTAARPPRPRA